MDKHLCLYLSRNTIESNIILKLSLIKHHCPIICPTKQLHIHLKSFGFEFQIDTSCTIMAGAIQFCNMTSAYKQYKNCTSTLSQVCVCAVC